MRFLYRCLLRAHPRGFRAKFAAEMLWIYDQRRGLSDVASLFADGLASLLRQWVLRPRLRNEGSVAESVAEIAGRPIFQTFGSSMPTRSALFQGVTASIIMFLALGFVAGHGARHPYLVIEEPSFFNQPDLAQRALDANRDGIIAAAEIANASAVLRTLDRDHDGALSASECGAPARYGPQFMLVHPVVAALDADHDGVISAAEIANASAALKTLDRDGDGDLSENELRPDADSRLSLLTWEFRKITRRRLR
jgi:uncharacterized protein YuzE